MIRVAGRIFAAVVLLLLTVWLLRDATTYALHAKDSSSGRARGGYTDLEIMLGFREPNGWVRLSEFILGLACGFSAVKVFPDRNTTR